MAISDTARKNHDELFPGRVSTRAVTDPELIEYSDTFAFDALTPGARARSRPTSTSATAASAVPAP
ncbi:hypothetical protein AB0C12_33605 [Actinoplanes sp. NPDC048967]|uniref:hypothetical protein n=1 Tax=Actinoplanes sp. NPDC048967 TaxID=3155269 RepID=UPI00340A0D18